LPEVQHVTTARLPVETIWDFVREMDNWAEFVAGYQSHEKLSEDDSVWVLKGDVGVLARTVKFQVHVEEWAGPSHVVFSLKGVNEPMEGSGTFLLEAYEAEAPEGASPGESTARKEGLLSRLFARIARFFYRLVHGRAQRGAGADEGPGAGMAKLTFRLRVDPGGPMAPMVNAMMRPMMLPAAEDLANRIMATLEERHGLRS
jgi:carbon monoxide dehydrogenase subunit G